MYTDEDIREAKSILRDSGYFVDNLWHVDDVMETAKELNLDVDEDDAQDILYDALTNDATMEQIWFAIRLYTQEHDTGE